MHTVRYDVLLVCKAIRHLANMTPTSLEQLLGMPTCLSIIV